VTENARPDILKVDEAARIAWDNDVTWPDEVIVRNGLWNDEKTQRNADWLILAAQRNAFAPVQYAEIFGAISPSQKNGWNGYLLLVVMAGGITYLSAVVNMKVMAKKTAEKEKVEPVIQYSMRDAKAEPDNSKPAPNPMANPMMGKMMKFVLPAVMVLFAFSSTAALAIYIITNSAVTTATSLGMNGVADKLVAKSDKNKEEQDGPVINPHAKYFKNKKK
jgi:membrane protein insertase Oxa1/YidC/SpoIIIJ